MNAQTKVEAPGLAKLREPFPDNQISKLPKETRAQIDGRKQNKGLMVWNCPVCGNHHHKDAVHLDYVGHAAATDRLLDTDIEWTWEPLALDQHGLPAFDENGGLWIRLTVCGVSRLGYGSADGKTGGDAKKEIIGDAIRNAGMRFGMALDLWHKGVLHGDAEDAGSDAPADNSVITDEQVAILQGYANSGVIDAQRFCKFFQIGSFPELPASRWNEAMGMAKAKAERAAPKADPTPEKNPVLEPAK